MRRKAPSARVVSTNTRSRPARDVSHASVPRARTAWGTRLADSYEELASGYDTLVAALVDTFSRLNVWRHLVRLFYLIAAVTMLLITGRIVFLMMPSVPTYKGFDLSGSGSGVRWFGFPDLSSIKQFVPNVVLHPLDVFSDAQLNSITSAWRDHSEQIAQLTKAKNLHDSSLDRLKTVVPKIVHMDMGSDGLPVISQDFWHALRNLIYEDELILTLTRPKLGNGDISDLHWLAVKRRLEKSGIGAPVDAKNNNLSLSEIEEIVERTSSRSWERWLKENQQRVRDFLDGPSGENKPAGSDSKVGSVVTHDEFIRLFQTEFTVHRHEIKAEMDEMEGRITKLVDETVAAASAATSSAPAVGLTKAEVQAIAQQAVQRAIGDAQLEAMAKGHISANWHADLSHQVNYFDQGTGAVIHLPFTSPTWQPPARRFRSPEYERHMRALPGSSSSGVQGQAQALTRWEDIGDCWCAATRARDNGTLPADVSIRLGALVVPQHLVLEHINAGATPDPHAMPRDVEVWAHVEEYGRRHALLDFMYSQWQGTDSRHPLVDRSFVKIGAFTYDGGRAGGGGGAAGGVEVHKLSGELVNLGAATDHVIIRAATNYGADHTCFYRLRMYGQAQEEGP